MKKIGVRMMVAVLLSVSLFVLGACGKSQAEQLVGTWKIDTGSDYTWVFNDDGTAELRTGLGTETGVYSVDGNTINYTMNTLTGVAKSNSMEFSVKGDTLELTSLGHAYTYNRQ